MTSEMSDLLQMTGYKFGQVDNSVSLISLNSGCGVAFKILQETEYVTQKNVVPLPA